LVDEGKQCVVLVWVVELDNVLNEIVAVGILDKDEKV
jgi:hypothetical protein